MASAIVSKSPQPSAVPITTPSTSPIAQPVRQWSVAEKATRFSDWEPWPACGLRDELIGDRERLVEDRDPLVELVDRDVQRRADHHDVPVRHQVQAALERRLAEPRDGRERLTGGVERDERLARLAVADELEAPEAPEAAN